MIKITKIDVKIYRTIFLLSLGAFIFQSCQQNTSKSNMLNSGLKIGYAEVNYTPRVGLDLVGNYRGDDYASRGIHDSLYGKALVAEGSNGIKTAILSVDICNIPVESVDMMRNYVESASDIKAENILIHATHTHSGPKSNLDAPEAKNYLQKAANAIIEANQNISFAELKVGRTKENRVSHNRRLKAIDGTTHMVWEKFEPGFIEKALGEKDPELITVSFEQNGEITGTIVNFGCHPTTLTGNNWNYSADYPGYLTEAIQKVNGDDFGVLFLNAPSGNVTQVDHKVGFLDTYQECQRIGYLLGVASLEAMKKTKLASGDGSISILREEVPIKKMTISDEQYEWAKMIMKRVEKNGMPALQPDGIPEELYAKWWIDMYKVQNETDKLEVMVIQIGDVAIVGLPGEIFNEFGKYIKENSPFKSTIVVGLANGDYDYFPTETSFSQGPKGFKPMITGYETTPGTTKYDIGAGEKLAESAVKQLNSLFKK
ncbi:neutral/alkaline non-lysosomal ceramidase N-terminal domain-containing protein [Aurantibacter crassamenti]|uniref:neutral/alkaline non-lysosomal ceramidase N-terminal domain-containing protein n=1 Tax=Aurantibacter crassamenti TaxID=1837375 RepID=UPI0019397898|nr:neutral/alkaline non-lysosomal ceramidase N-terminal domain-containing protein [Aurantibacter crassamenti]MBM1105048.1 neutral/alkaline non-lysosomal ceramidase N-terminal domain-containing protein [Aurantibacter crassamenti]